MQLLLIDGNHIMYSVLFRHIAKAKKRGDYEEATEKIADKACKQFTATIKKLTRRFKTSHMCVIFDNDAQNFRHRLSPIYKANRKERPKEVFPLKQKIYETFSREGIPYFYASDHEGDDLIGTIAKRAEEHRRIERIILFSGDMDLAQLVTKKTHLYQISTSIFQGTWVTHKNVKSILEVEPEQLPTLKAMLGDRTDNIKGISGLRRFNVLKLMEKHPDIRVFLDLPKSKLKTKTEQLVWKHRDHVLNNLLLANIRCDMHFQIRWEDLRVAAWAGGGGRPDAAGEGERAGDSAGTGAGAAPEAAEKAQAPSAPRTSGKKQSAPAKRGVSEEGRASERAEAAPDKRGASEEGGASESAEPAKAKRRRSRGGRRRRSKSASQPKPNSESTE